MKTTRIYLIGVVVLIIINLFLLFQLKKITEELKNQRNLQESKETILDNQFEYTK